MIIQCFLPGELQSRHLLFSSRLPRGNEQADRLNKKGLKKFLEMGAYYGIFYDIGGVAGAAPGQNQPAQAAKLLGLSNAGLASLEFARQMAKKGAVLLTRFPVRSLLLLMCPMDMFTNKSQGR